LAQPIFVKFSTLLVHSEKVVHKFELLLSLKNYPKVNNHPIDENSTNLVTLPEIEVPFPGLETLFQSHSIDYEEKESFSGLRSTVARWFCFKPKIPIWVNLGGSCNGILWYIL
jgi:hypothetical protein